MGAGRKKSEKHAELTDNFKDNIGILRFGIFAKNWKNIFNDCRPFKFGDYFFQAEQNVKNYFQISCILFIEKFDLWKDNFSDKVFIQIVCYQCSGNERSTLKYTLIEPPFFLLSIGL